jgi:hypothetical protein
MGKELETKKYPYNLAQCLGLEKKNNLRIKTNQLKYINLHCLYEVFYPYLEINTGP